MKQEKIIIYQLLPRLFGNTNEKCIPNGSLEENLFLFHGGQREIQ